MRGKITTVVIVLLVFLLSYSVFAASSNSMTHKVYYADAYGEQRIDLTTMYPSGWTSALIQVAGTEQDYENIIDETLMDYDLENGNYMSFYFMPGVDIMSSDGKEALLFVDVELEVNGVKELITIHIVVRIYDVKYPFLAFSEDVITKNITDSPFTNYLYEDGFASTGITYSSTNENVATVDSNGVVSIHAAGTTVIDAYKPPSADGEYSVAATAYMLTVNGSTNATENYSVYFASSIKPEDSFESGHHVIYNEGGRLAGYSDYSGYLGEAVSNAGVTQVVLYREFLHYLQQNRISQFPLVFHSWDEHYISQVPHIIYINITMLNEYIVSFDSNEGTGAMEYVTVQQTPGATGTNYVLPKSTFTPPTGMKFARWAIGHESYPGFYTDFFDVGETCFVQQDVVFYPIWESTPIVYHKIKIETEGKGAVTPNGGSDDIENVEEKTDKTFDFKPSEGWSIKDVQVDSKSVKSVSKYTFEDIEKDHTIKVIFEEIISTEKFSVSYNANGGEGGTVPSSENDAGADVVIPANSFTNKELVFIGWNTEPNGSGVNYSPKEVLNMPQQDIVLYAQWKDLNSTESSEVETDNATTGSNESSTSGEGSGETDKDEEEGESYLTLVIILGAILLLLVGAITGFAINYFINKKKTEQQDNNDNE